MKINRNNYEEFFIDYLDGHLSEAQILELEDFLLLNPALREELEGMEKVVLDPLPTSYPNKTLLKQINLEYPIDQENYDFFLIAEEEGDLLPEQKNALEEFVSHHPELKDERKLYSKLHLSSRDNELYKDKQLLKKSPLIIYRREIISFSAIAASVLFMVGVYFTFFDSKVQDRILQTAVNNEVMVDSVKTVSPVKIKNEAPPVKDTEKKDELSTIRSTPKINFKVDMPVASLDEAEKENNSSYVLNEDTLETAMDLAGNINIKNAQLAVFDLSETRIKDQIKVTKDPVKPYKGINLADPSKYLTIEQFAKQKLSELVFGKANQEENLNAFNLVSAGITKINKLTGTDMKLQKSIDEQGNDQAILFDSKVLSVTRPTKK